MNAPRLIATAISIALVAAGCGSSDEKKPAQQAPERLPQGGERVRLDPADFTTRIDNPYWPMAPGSRWVSRETGGGTTQDVVVTVTNRTKRIANGIEARVVHDVVSEHGKPVEDTFDWFAQDREGNIWYLGEDTKEYENGRVKSTEGSFEAGVDGAQGGVALPAHPQVGMRYRQEHYAGHAEDAGQVLSLDEQVQVPFGHFDGVLMTKDTTPLEPDVVEHKFYAKGIGPVKTVAASGGGGDELLLEYRRGHF
jgi:hypothetical protein